MKNTTKRFVAALTGLLFSVHVVAAGFPFQPGQILNANDLNTALQTAAITSGSVGNVSIVNSTISNSTGSFNTLTSPSVNLTGGLINSTSIGVTGQSTGEFTSLSASSSVSGAGITALFASPPAIGSTTAGTGAFTTLTASTSVSGVGVTSLFASPPVIGGTSANAATFTTLNSASLGVTGTATASAVTATNAVSAVTGVFTNVNTSGTETAPFVNVTNNLTASGVTVTNVLTSNVATGTAPFVVSSTTPVANLSIGGNAATATTAAGFTGTAACKIAAVSASVAANAMTVGVSAQYLDFRSANAGSGVVSTINAAPANIVIPSGATLGTISAVASTIVVAEMNNGGTAELAVANISGGLQMDETNLISTTAISSVSSASNIWYSTTARTSLPYRIVGRIDSTQTVAGTWATAPSLIQGAGGNAITAMSSLGYGQTWQSFTSGTRVSGTTYYDTTGKPIFLYINAASINLVVGGTTVFNASGVPVSAVIPPGMAYSATYGSGLTWSELR